MFSLKIKVRKDRLKQNSKSPIFYYLVINRKKFMFSTGLDISPDQFDEKAQEIKKTYPGYNKINSILSLQKIQINNLVFEEINKKIPVEIIAKRVKNYVSGSSIKSSGECYYTFWKDLIIEKQQLGKFGLADVYQRILNQFQKYDNKVEGFEYYDYQWFLKFKLFKTGLGISDNTISYYLRTARAVWNEALNRDVIKDLPNPFKKGLVPSPSLTRKRNINGDEIQMVLNYQPKNKNEELAKDIFLFGFYAIGMDLVDIVHLTKSSIMDGRIEYNRIKTGQPISVKINKQLAEIINKYENNGPFIFPILKVHKNSSTEGIKHYNQFRTRFSLHLNNIKKSIGLEKDLTSKVTRHSWATIAKRIGIPVDVIREALGHVSKITTTIYLDSYEADVIDEANEKVINHVLNR